MLHLSLLMANGLLINSRLSGYHGADCWKHSLSSIASHISYLWGNLWKLSMFLFWGKWEIPEFWSWWLWSWDDLMTDSCHYGTSWAQWNSSHPSVSDSLMPHSLVFTCLLFVCAQTKKASLNGFQSGIQLFPSIIPDINHNVHNGMERCTLESNQFIIN